MTKMFNRLKVNDALNKISGGDLSALTALYDYLGRQIFTLALSVVRNTEDAEDVMQETFAKIIEKIGTYRVGGNGRAWVMTIARNVAIDTLRERKHTVALEGLEQIPVEYDLTEKAEMEELLSCLGETDRDIIILKLAGGFKLGEIAEIVGLSRAATEKRYRRALSKLKSNY